MDGWLAILFLVGAVAILGFLLYMARGTGNLDQGEGGPARTPFDPPPF